ncbi:2TM domain-containing protein [Cellulophaga sp. E16_2]|uniref:2TM domain-containing protein n=1 Tax=Cellulophaga sp. E16_2 TaxID=2789297 RepID=UPI001A930B9C|nr:2TM domain-containing protein [Cellulophaga sp. E16_2]MBO0589939.1 2TM domain-containing protein [Cellulophaga sp. E16_2]
MEIIQRTKLERAQKRVATLKGFYDHLTIYLIINILVFIFKGKFIITLLSKEALGNPQILNWINWNVYGAPIIWGIGVLIHGLVVFKIRPSFLSKWEDRKIKKYMNEERESSSSL